MNILFISLYLDNKFFKKIFDEALEKPIQSVQKFDSLIVGGLEKNEKVNKVDVFSMACVNRKISKKLFWKGKNITEGKAHFNYIPFINLKFLKQICCLIYTIFFALYFGILNLKKRNNTYVLCDGFFPVASTMSIIILKIFGYKVLTYYTDLPKINFDTENKAGIVKYVIKKIINFGDVINQKLSDCFMFLTEQMNDVINKENKPYIIIEGLCDINYDIEKENKKYDKKIIFYAGGLYEKYGVKLLIDSFIKWNNDKYELWLCGSNGDILDYITNIKNTNVKYLGGLPNKEVVEIEKKCYLLINPRFTNEEYTKYSFPSKTMEYMLSGTPVLTTKLQGIPNEYNDYLYYIEKETEEGFIDSFENIDRTSKNKLEKKGKEAQKFVYEKKNNIVQCNKILSLLEKIKSDNINDNLELLSLIVLTFITIVNGVSSKILLITFFLIWFYLTFNWNYIKNNIKLIITMIGILMINVFSFAIKSNNISFSSITNMIRVFSIIYMFFYYADNYLKKKKIIKNYVIYTSFLLIFINVITIIANMCEYNLSRLLSTAIYNGKNYKFVGAFTYIYGLVFILMPLLQKYFRNRKKKLLDIITIATSLICIIECEFFFSYIFILLFILLIVFKIDSIKKILKYTLLIITFIIIVSKPLAILLNYTANKIDNYNIQLRLRDIAKVLDGNYEESVDIKARIDNYLTSIETFKTLPITGTYLNKNINLKIGGHSNFLDILAKYGIIGGLLYFILYYFIIKKQTEYSEKFKNNISFYFIVIFIIFNLCNPTFFAGLMFMILIIANFYQIEMNIGEENENIMDS